MNRHNNNLNSILCNPVLQKAASVLFVILGVVLPMLLVRFEVYRFIDESYQAYCCLEWRRAWPAMLTFFVGDKWMSLFGKSFIALRIQMTVCYVSAAAIGSLYARKKGVPFLQSAAIFMIGAIGLVMSCLPIYGWDAGAYPATALCMLATFLYIDSPRRSKVILMGCCAGLLSLFRLPGAAVIGIMALSVIAAQWKNRTIVQTVTDLIILIGCASAVFCLGITLLTGSVSAYFNAITTENTVRKHTLSDLPEMIIFSKELLFKQYRLMLPPLVVIILSVCFAKAHRKNWFLLLIAILALYYSVRGASLNLGDWAIFWSHNGLLIPCGVLMALFIPLYYGLKGVKANLQNSLPTIVLLLFVLLPGFGSDAVSERLGWGLCFIFAFGVNAEKIKKCRKFINYFLFFTAVILIGYYAIIIHRLEAGWNETVRTHFTPTINGTRSRPYSNEYCRIDSIKSVMDNAKSIGLGTGVFGNNCATYTFILEETSPNSTMRYIPTREETIADFQRLREGGCADLIVWMDAEKDSLVNETIKTAGYKRYIIVGDNFEILTTDSIRKRLPDDPFSTWGYREPEHLPAK